MKAVTVVGTSVAGVSAAETLRRQGFDGTITLIGDESCLPYDRPPLSKEALWSARDAETLLLRPAGTYDELGITLRLGAPAVGLDLAGRAVALGDGDEVCFDGLIIATGARATWPAAWPRLDGVHTLRSMSDAERLRPALVPGSRVLVVGAGFIGLEVAAAARELGADVTVIEAAPYPLAHAVGQLAGEAIARMHEARGVEVVLGRRVESLLGDERVEGVILDDGERLVATTVVVGLGSTPNTEWLAGSGLPVDGGVACDAACWTGTPGVFAAGDVARWTSHRYGRNLRVEHWTNALEQGALAAANILRAPGDRQRHDPVPYFWSDQYGKRLQFAGHLTGGEEAELVHGSLDAEDWVLTFRQAGRTVGVFACDQPRLFLRYRRELSLTAERRT